MITVYDHFLTDDECDTYITMINNFAAQKHVPFSNSATNFNHKYIDEKLAQSFYDRCREKQIQIDTIGPNNLIMMAKYQKGESFGIHTDTGLYYNKANNTKTRYTLLIYLNDNFIGGNTIFYTDHLQVLKTIVPKKGSCLLFDIDLWHEGCEVLDGYKYWIGCELIGSF